MSSNCKIVQDILPLYVDEICSDESREFVDTHIKDCKECDEYLNRLKNDNNCVENIKTETEEVIEHHVRKQKRSSFFVGMIFSGILMIPLITCMIVNLATGHGLSWFFIVLASLLVLSSVTVVPLMAARNKGLWTLGTFVATVTALLAVICIYSHGKWFFVAELGFLTGMTYIFAPILAATVFKELPGRIKALLIIGMDTVLTILLLIAIGVLVKNKTYWTISSSIAVMPIVFAWVILLIAGFIKTNRKIKAGLITAWCGLFYATVENIVFMLMGYTVVWHAFHPLGWSGATLSSNLHWCVGVSCAVIGAVLIGFGIKDNKRNN